jgi:hypothetical protein
MKFLSPYRIDLSRWYVGLSICLASLIANRPLAAQEAAVDAKSAWTPATEFLRLSRTEARLPKSLEVATTTYRSDDPAGVSVDLIGAVHIGERRYYSELNKLFDSYDVLLYELVAAENTVIPKGGKREGSNPVAMLQDAAKSMLGLESQLEWIDYTKSHMVRADMTPQQIASKMEERGETAMTIALSTMADMMRQQNLAARKSNQQAEVNPLSDTSLFDLLGDPTKMKQIMAEQFVATGSLDQSLGGALNQMLVVDRNAEALKGLQKQIAAGKKKIGVFYGAAHMPDFEKRLTTDFGLKKVDQKWLVAWDLQRSSKPSVTEPAGLLLNLLKALGE